MKKAFKVKAGIHIEDGKTYRKDEIVVSDKDLIKLFPQKFEDQGRVADDEEEPEPAEEPQASPPSKKSRAKKKAVPPKPRDEDWD